MYAEKRIKMVIYKGDEYTVEDEITFNGEKMYFKLFKKLYVR
jgi:hypothetical protein